MKENWRSAWHGQDIVVYRNEDEVDRIHAPAIRRVVFVHGGVTLSAGDLAYCVVETEDECVVLPAATGFAGAVHFERQPFWAEKRCVYWADGHVVSLPARFRQGVWFLWPRGARFCRVPRAELATVLDQWPLEGPQTWDERRWQRIERNRAFGRTHLRDEHTPGPMSA
jgi:hypothetical protein